MKAIVTLSSGGPDVLALGDVPDPIAGQGEVVLEVRATALNRADLLQRRGLYPPPAGAPAVLGLECSGVVWEVGAGVVSVKPGDRVMALLSGGGYAERVAVHERLCLPIPEGMSFEDAAALPEAFLTASEALFGLGELRPGEWVLVHAAGSGVGTAALQLARAVGARVIATTSEAKVARVSDLGPERVVAREREDFAAVVAERTGGAGVSLILDLVGGSYFGRNQRCLALLGRHVVIGLVGGAKAEIDLSRVLSRRQTILGMVMRTRPLADKIRVVERFRREHLARFDSGELRPIVDSVLPLAEAARAHERMESNQSFGKIVLRVGAPEHD